MRIPEAQARNWLGNLRSPHAALNLLAQGGIPTQGIAQAGRVTWVEMEHVWVEAHVDYYPSRGARNFVPDAWVPLDAAFKQYDYAEGLPLETEVPFDAQGFVDELLQSATIDESAGTISGLDTAHIEATFSSYLDEVNTYIEAQHPEATVGEVIGQKTIQPWNATQLAASLPYTLITQGPPLSALPPSLRGYYSYTLYASAQDAAYDTPAFTFRDSLPNLGNTRLSLAFEPATDDDRETMESYLPEPDENGEIDPNDLPESLPGYLINLTAEFRRDGEVIHTAGPFPMGTELTSQTSITRLTGGNLTAINHPIAGEYRALGLSLPGGQGEKLESIQQRLQATQAQLEAEDYASLSKDQLVGDLLTAAVNGYFAAAITQMELLNRQADGQPLMQPGFGLVNTVLEADYRHGVPREVRFAGLGVDIDGAVISAINTDDTAEGRIQLVQQMGTQLSALEHRILEVLFTDEDNPGEAASTVKALSTAAAQGQTIYTLDASNSHYLNQITATEAIKTDIRNAINAGLVATIHEAPVSIGGWVGTGYSLIDPQTGAGAYRIGGGENGGKLKLFLGTLAFLLAFKIAFVGAIYLVAVQSASITAVLAHIVGGLTYGVSLGKAYNACENGISLATAIIALTIAKWVAYMSPPFVYGFAAAIAALFVEKSDC